MMFQFVSSNRGHTLFFMCCICLIMCLTGCNSNFEHEWNTYRHAYELAKKSNLKIVGIENDALKVRDAQKRLDEAGFYGSRIIIEQWNLSALPDYFANLIVSDEMIISGKMEWPVDDIYRVLKPYGGLAYLGQPRLDPRVMSPIDQSNLYDRLRTLHEKIEKDSKSGNWIKLTRGKLEGAGSWTHLYGNPQNTACSDDQLVKFPLGVLWYGAPGPQKMVERHAKSAAPVASNGRFFVQGENVISAYDSYNGTFLWEREIPGALRVRVDVDGSNLVVADNGLFVAAGSKCIRLDPATGKTIRTYELPLELTNKQRRWGYLAC